MKIIEVEIEGKTVEMEVPEGFSNNQISVEVDKIASQLASKQPVKSQQLNVQSPNIPQLAQASLGPFAVAERIKQLPSPVRRGVLTGGAAAIGELASPVGAGIGAMAGGTLADMADNPQKATEILTSFAKSGLAAQFNPTKALPAFTEAVNTLKGIDLKGVAKKRAAEAILGASGAIFTKVLTGFTVTGPLTATIKKPSLIFKSVRKKDFKTLNRLKKIAKQGEIASESKRLLQLSASPPGRAKLAVEATVGVQSKVAMSGRQLITYRNALKRVIQEGGEEAADEFITALKTIEKTLEKQVPGITKAFDAAKDAVRAVKGGSDFSLLGLIFKPKTSVASAFTPTIVKQATGVTLGLGAKGAAGVTAGVGTAALQEARKLRQ